MIFGGLIKNSFVDYPQNISAVIFTAGCNMDCWYCHNKNLITVTQNTMDRQEKLKTEIFDFLNERKNFLDGVVISGGEPTIYEDLQIFITQIKALGYKVKLDTNGTNPACIKKLLDSNLVDYIAMDIKAPFNKYATIIKTKFNISDIKKSINLIMSSKIDYEFRTTFALPLEKNDLVQIAQSIIGAKHYYIQKYKSYNLDDLSVSLPSELLQAQVECSKFVKNCVTRGL